MQYVLKNFKLSVTAVAMTKSAEISVDPKQNHLIALLILMYQ